MYTSLVLSTILLFCTHGGLAIDCPQSSANWCDNREVAQACGVSLRSTLEIFVDLSVQVVSQCTEYVWAVAADNDRVNLS